MTHRLHALVPGGVRTAAHPSSLFFLPRVHSACALPYKHPGFAAPLAPRRTPLHKSSPQRALSAGFSVPAPTQLSVAGENKITNQTCISLYLLDHQPPVGSCHHPQFFRVQHQRTSWESPGPLRPLRLVHAGPAPSPSPPACPTGSGPGLPLKDCGAAVALRSPRRNPSVSPRPFRLNAQAPWVNPSWDKKQAASPSISSSPTY